jgi:hypothetical protein
MTGLLEKTHRTQRDQLEALSVHSLSSDPSGELGIGPKEEP